jgi:hypothetical protein
MAGFIIAVIAGWLVPNGRRAAAVVIIPWLAVLTVETWIIAAGRDDSPPSTVYQLPGAIGYWLVQAVLLAVSLGIAWQLGALRARRSRRPYAADTARRQAAIASSLLAAAATVFIAVTVLTSAAVHHHSSTGSPPPVELIGWALSLVTFAALSVATIRRRGRRERERRRAPVAGA